MQVDWEPGPTEIVRGGGGGCNRLILPTEPLEIHSGWNIDTNIEAYLVDKRTMSISFSTAETVLVVSLSRHSIECGHVMSAAIIDFPFILDDSSS